MGTREANSVCRATVSPECIDSYNKLKLDKVYKYIVFKLSDDNRQIVVEEASADKDWDSFRETLINATTKSKSVCTSQPTDSMWQPYSSCFDRVLSARDPATLFTTSNTSLPRAKEHGTKHLTGKHVNAAAKSIIGTRLPSSPGRQMMLVSWPVSPETLADPLRSLLTLLQAKMVYASSKEALKRSLPGIAVELQANDSDDIEFDSVLKTVSKGLAGK